MADDESDECSDAMRRMNETTFEREERARPGQSTASRQRAAAQPGFFHDLQIGQGYWTAHGHGRRGGVIVLLVGNFLYHVSPDLV